jgi:hypothetical protein
MSLSTSQVLQNRYHITTQLGQGGFGAVYQAWDTSSLLDGAAFGAAFGGVMAGIMGLAQWVFATLVGGAAGTALIKILR